MDSTMGGAGMYPQGPQIPQGAPPAPIAGGAPTPLSQLAQLQSNPYMAMQRAQQEFAKNQMMMRQRTIGAGLPQQQQPGQPQGQGGQQPYAMPMPSAGGAPQGQAMGYGGGAAPGQGLMPQLSNVPPPQFGGF